ncbi:hypothetical protein PLICRDRAFT_132520 [Plicaturopsis crispa FD-325 SS-3]|nr:hypothetical protein PLICRDRAFT_132520 [Plicaturopsis crispa FD-325 SS-3]
MDTSIQHRLLRAQNDFFSAMAGDTPMDAFEVAWEELKDDFAAAMQNGALSDETTALANRIASSMAVFTRNLLDQSAEIKQLSSSSEQELAAIFAEIDLESSSYHSDPRSSDSVSSDSSRTDIFPAPVMPSEPSPCPPYIASAYKWLVKNLHNPYPTTELKEKIARSSGSSLKTINAWFTSVRRRIGWTKILRKHFNNCRHDMLTAAYSYLVEDLSSQSSNKLIECEFVQMKLNAEALYAPQFKKSELAGTLDTVLKDLSPEDRERQQQAKEMAVFAAQQQKEQERADRRKERALEKATERMRAASSLPSPASSSREATAEPGESEDDATPPPAAASRKRRASSSSDSDYHTDAVSNKRPRISRPSSPTSVYDGCTSLPSPQSSAPSPEPSTASTSAMPTASAPAPSSHKRRLSDVYPSDTPEQADDAAHPQSSAATTAEGQHRPTAPAPSRKRRLSDASLQGVPKRPRGLDAGPRMQTVSDPFPLAKAPEVEDWFHQNFSLLDFSMPSAVTAGELDLSTTTDVEVLWNPPAFESDPTVFTHGDYFHFSDSLSTSSQDEASPSNAQSTLPSSAFDLSNLPTYNTEDSAPTDSYDLSSYIPHSSSAPVTPPSDEWNPYLSLGNDKYLNESDGLSVPFMLEPRFASEDPFSGNGSEGISAASIADMFSIPPHADVAAVKQAKLEELRRYREAARKLEEELASSDP